MIFRTFLVMIMIKIRLYVPNFYLLIHYKSITIRNIFYLLLKRYNDEHRVH